MPSARDRILSCRAAFLPGNTALMIPKTADGRVLFAIPWHGALVVGTTDVPIESKSAEPRALPEEKQFLREHIARYMGRAPRPEEILSVWSGLRPLVRQGGAKTSKLSRDHTILVSSSGLITVTGGKWTTYRRMGQDTIDRAEQVAALPKRPLNHPRPQTAWLDRGPPSSASPWECLRIRSSSASGALRSENNLETLLHPRLPFRSRSGLGGAQRDGTTVEDVLARRTRALFSMRAQQLKPRPPSRLLASELTHAKPGRRRAWRAFLETAKGYLYEE